MSDRQSVGKRALMVAVSLAYWLLRGGYRTAARLICPVPAPASPIVLTYHAVRDEEARRFEWQMQDLKAHAAVVFADDATTLNRRRTVAVTFDDAFQSVFDRALPIMARYQIPATVFVPTGSLGAETGWVPAARRLPGSSGVLASADTLAASDPHLVRLGSHTVTHSYLTSLSEAQLNAELVVSKQTLEELSVRMVTILSFPFGSFDTRVLKAAGASGYKQLFANIPVRPGAAGVAQLIGRINVTPRDCRLEFRLKFRGAYEWLALAIPAKRAVLRWLGWDRRA